MHLLTTRSGELVSLVKPLCDDRGCTGCAGLVGLDSAELVDFATVVDRPDSGTTALVSAAVGFLERIGRAVIFGASEGGPAAMVFAARRPERTLALMLTGTSSYWGFASPGIAHCWTRCCCPGGRTCRYVRSGSMTFKCGSPACRSTGRRGLGARGCLPLGCVRPTSSSAPY